MQKKIIALAIAGLASTAAFAQSNVTIYGIADMGFGVRQGNSGGVNGVKEKNEFASGMSAGSRIGFKGVEDLGNGLKALFEVEYGISLDSTAGTSAVLGNNNTAAAWNNRHSYVGLTGGFGTVVTGRLDGVRYGVFNTYDPFAGGGVGNFTQMTYQVDRANNAIAYISPNFAGFGVVLAYSTSINGQETTANNGGANGLVVNFGDQSLQTIMLTYDNGPISARLDYEQAPFPGFGFSKSQVMTGAGSYDFGVVKVSALIDQIKNSDLGLKQVSWMVGAKAPIGKFVARAMVGQVRGKDDKVDLPFDVSGTTPSAGGGKSTKWGLGADYLLSKRTALYADYGQIHNASDANRQINWAANSNGIGVGTIGFDFAMRHSF